MKQSKKAETIGARLARFRAEEGKSLREMGPDIALDPSQLAKIEKDFLNLPVDSMVLLEQKYHCNLHWLITGTGDPYAGKQSSKLVGDVKRYIGSWSKELKHPTSADLEEVRVLLKVIEDWEKG